MVIYLFPGLGADERVFSFLNIKSECRIIKWVDPFLDDTIESYAVRISEQIDPHIQNVLLGVSFGGVVAIEAAKHLTLNNLILISSVESHLQLPRSLGLLKSRTALKAVMTFYNFRPIGILSKVFGTRNRRLLRDILADTEKSFVLWALSSLAKWSGFSTTQTTLRIHGSKDLIIPLRGEAVEIEGGGHFMIVDEAEVISRHVNEFVENLSTSN